MANNMKDVALNLLKSKAVEVNMELLYYVQTKQKISQNICPLLILNYT